MEQHSGDRMTFLSIIIRSQSAMTIAPHIAIDSPGGAIARTLGLSHDQQALLSQTVGFAKE
jgi:hypothetical protein